MIDGTEWGVNEDASLDGLSPIRSSNGSTVGST